MERLEYRAELEWDGNVGSFARVREFQLRTDTNTDGGNEGASARRIPANRNRRLSDDKLGKAHKEDAPQRRGDEHNS